MLVEVQAAINRAPSGEGEVALTSLDAVAGQASVHLSRHLERPITRDAPFGGEGELPNGQNACLPVRPVTRTPLVLNPLIRQHPDHSADGSVVGEGAPAHLDGLRLNAHVGFPASGMFSSTQAIALAHPLNRGHLPLPRP